MPREKATRGTDHRLEATPIAGEPGRFGGDPSAPFVQTPCCQQWRGCDTAWVSLRGGGRCQVEHERVSLGSAHDEDTHSGSWHTCQPCRDFWAPQDDKTYADHPINWPRF